MDLFKRIQDLSAIYDDDGPSAMVPESRPMFNDGGMLVKPNADGSRPGYAKDETGSLYKSGNGYAVQFGDGKSPTKIFQYFGAKKYGSLAKAKKAAKNFKTETAKTWTPQQTKPGIKQPAAEKAIQELLDEGTEITTKNILNKIPKKILKDGVADSVINKAKKKFPNLDFIPFDATDSFRKAPKEIARVKKLIEDGLPLKEIQAKGFGIRFIKRVARVNELKIAETSYDYYKNVKKITKDLTKIGKNKKIIEAFENGTVSNKLLEQVKKITKSKDPFYDSRLLFKLAEYYEGSLEQWYKPKLNIPTENQKLSADKVIKSSAVFQGGKRNGYAYQNDLYKWGAKQIDQVLGLPLGTFKAIQEDIRKQLPSGISLDEVFGVKASGRYSPIEGILTNPLESGANVDKGTYVDNIKSNYQSQLVEAAGDPKKQKEILKTYNEAIKKSKVRYPDVEFPDYKVGQPPNKTIKGFDKLPPLIQNKLLENYKTTGISPVTKKAVSIFDVAKATGSKTFTKLDEATQANLSNMSSKQEQVILQNIQSYSKLKQCRVNQADGGRIGFKFSDECIRDGLKEQKIEAQKGNKKAAQELVQVGKVATRAGLLKNLLGPGAILGEAVVEGAIIGNKVLGGKPADIAWAESYLSYLDPRKYSGQLDPLKMKREDMTTREIEDADGNIKTIDGPNANILRSGFAAQDQLSAFNKALQDRELAKARGRTDQYNVAAADAREQGRFADQSADIISSEAFKDASNMAQEYIQAQEGQRMFPYNQFKQSIGRFESGEARDLRKKREKAMLEKFPMYTQEEADNMYKKFKIEKPENFNIDIFNNVMSDYNKMSYFADNFRTEKAGGGIAKMAGDRSGAMTRSMNPDSQGLSYLFNRVKKV